VKIAFIGLGNMGSGMAANQARSGRSVAAFDLSAAALQRAQEAGARPAGSAADAVSDAEVVITMLPAGPHVRKVYDEAVFGKAPRGALLIDCSTIDPNTAREVPAGPERGLRFADAPSAAARRAEAGSWPSWSAATRRDFADVEARSSPCRGRPSAPAATAPARAPRSATTWSWRSPCGTCEAIALAERLGAGSRALLRDRVQVLRASPGR
jgi:3-hydroxyisobutyrate dehydrogenase